MCSKLSMTTTFMSLSGELMTERIGRPRSLMSATDLAHNDYLHALFCSFTNLLYIL